MDPRSSNLILSLKNQLPYILPIRLQLPYPTFLAGYLFGFLEGPPLSPLDRLEVVCLDPRDGSEGREGGRDKEGGIGRDREGGRDRGREG